MCSVYNNMFLLMSHQMLYINVVLLSGGTIAGVISVSGYLVSSDVRFTLHHTDIMKYLPNRMPQLTHVGLVAKTVHTLALL